MTLKDYITNVLFLADQLTHAGLQFDGTRDEVIEGHVTLLVAVSVR